MAIKADEDAQARIEAALYAAGRPLKIEELIKASGTSSRTKTALVLDGIMKKTRSTFRALEVARLQDGSYVMQLKPEFSRNISRYASKPILANATLKTLSYIAYSQPITSKDLVSVRGSGVYAHLKELKQLSYITYESVGRLKIYRTTEKFQKYFGISGDTDTVREEFLKTIRRTSRVRAAPKIPAQG